MNILDKTSSLLCSQNLILDVNEILDKYMLHIPLSLNDLFEISAEDIKVLLLFTGDTDLDAVTANLTVMKMSNENPLNVLLQKKSEEAVKYIGNFLCNFNSYYSRCNKDCDNLKNKYKDIIKDGKINDLIINFEEFASFVDTLSLDIREKGLLKKEVGKSNVEKSLNLGVLEEDKELFLDVDYILLVEKDILNRGNKNMLDKGSLDYKIYMVLSALDGEFIKARINVFNQNMHRQSIKLLRDYVDSYNKLKDLIEE